MDEENEEKMGEMDPLNGSQSTKQLVERPDGFNKCYLLCLLLTVSIGTIQFGYMIGSWNVASDAYGKKNGWDDDDMTNKVMIVQALTTAGAAVGALFSGPAAVMGRWNCIMIANIFVATGVLFTLVNDFVALCIGRFIYGISVGAFSVFCPKYISETAPIEVKGPAGALSQVCITFGILVAFCCGLGIGDVDDDDIDSFEIQYYWYILFILPVVFSLIQVLLLWCVFPYDTPYMLKQKNKTEDLNISMNKIYKTEEIAQERIDIIVVEVGEDGEISYGKVCCDPKYSKATAVGITLAIFSQLTGINAIMFYSNKIFKGLAISATTVTALIGILNFLATLVGLALLYCFGRKSLMLLFNALMSITLLLLSYYSFDNNTTGMIVCVLLFICFFEFSTGCIVWLYLAEILQDKAASIATFIVWSTTLAIAIAIPLLLKMFQIGYLFLFFGICTVLGTIFIAIFMKETMGLTQKQIDALFRSKDNEKDD